MGTFSTEAVGLKSRADENRERTPEEIRQEMSSHRAAISDTISRLDDRIQEAVDWRTHVTEHPYVALGIATGVGFLVAGIFKRQASPQERITEALADGIEDLCSQASTRFEGLLNASAPRQKSIFQGALAALVTKAVTTYLRGNSTTQFTSPQSYQSNNK